MRQGRDMANAMEAIRARIEQKRLNRDFGKIQKRGYTGDRDTFMEQRAALDRAMAASPETGGITYTRPWQTACLPAPGAFDGCLLEGVARGLSGAISGAFFERRIMGFRTIKYIIQILETSLLATDVFIYCSHTDEYQELLKDPRHRMADYLPNDSVMGIIKSTQIDVIEIMLFYNSLVAEHEAFKLLTGNGGFPFLNQQAATIYGERADDFDKTYRLYDNCHKGLENDYIFMNACISKLMSMIVKPRFLVRPFENHKFRPLKPTIELIAQDMIHGAGLITGTPEGVAHGGPGMSLNPHYARQMGKDMKRLAVYAFKRAKGPLLDSMKARWPILAWEYSNAG